MLMKTKPLHIDFFFVEPAHHAIHAELENWARYVDSSARKSWVHPMWRKGRPNGRQWSMPVIREDIRILDASKMEIAVRKLPEKQAEAIRWCYVYRTTPAVAVRNIGCTYERLALLVRSGRQMLINRNVLHDPSDTVTSRHSTANPQKSSRA